MVKKLLLFISIATLCLAASETYKITLAQPCRLGANDLAPGSYKIELDGGKVTLTKGKQSFEAATKVETEATKYPSTSIRFVSGEGKNRIQEIRLGGTNMKLIFEM